jgi:hypothetical protein
MRVKGDGSETAQLELSELAKLALGLLASTAQQLEVATVAHRA